MNRSDRRSPFSPTTRFTSHGISVNPAGGTNTITAPILTRRRDRTTSSWSPSWYAGAMLSPLTVTTRSRRRA
jgi:hypothetical protein